MIAVVKNPGNIPQIHIYPLLVEPSFLFGVVLSEKQTVDDVLML